ncbi:hypothetical protein HHK36_028617 [Tetracentron sinense]|uniref:Uncharacterized protein n=1 Tax=Tetracentron sinense TaxID=13715 RepID=A0A834YCS6_TETSI|nr:hypothetical protein HHK36_028617 [Tetracentron sinense]
MEVLTFVLNHLLQFLRKYGVNVCSQNNHLDWVPLKFLILTLSLVQELQIIQEKTTDHAMKFKSNLETCRPDTVDRLSLVEASLSFEKVIRSFLFILVWSHEVIQIFPSGMQEELVSFAKSACSIFWSSNVMENALLPCSVRGKLGGPSQRRLDSSTTTTVLQAIISMKTVASISSWCAQFKNDVLLDFSFTFLWGFYGKIVSSSTCHTETGAEICLAAYEALVPVLKALVSAFSPLGLNIIMKNDKSLLPKVEGKNLLDSLVLSFLQNINDLLAVGDLARSRRAILLNWKWLCLDSLLSIPYHAIENGVHLESTITFFSDSAVRCIFADIVESLENAGEGSVLPILRSVRLVLGLLASGRMGSVVSSCDGMDTQLIAVSVVAVVAFSIAIVDCIVLAFALCPFAEIEENPCNKRRVASIAALLSSVLHSSVFSDERMHKTIDNAQGPLKWFVERILDEGTKSPRTIRLAALHLTGLWLLNPRMIKYYMKELKLLSLYGSVAFDEDFEAELAESHDARTEVSLLAKSPDPEMTEVC